ncbi:MAG: hypothetical protein ACT452_07915 [Microthrixaceae bacterium]
MKVLVNESEGGAADRAVEQLESQGHEVLRCHERGDGPFPCAGLRPGHVCPLRDPGVDVAVTVRSNPRSRPALLEDGIACALRARVPVVVAGQTLLNPYEGFGVEVVEGQHVVGAVERLAMAPSHGHSQVATDALLGALRAEPGEAIAVAYRRRSGVRVELEAVPTIERSAVKAAVPKVIAAVREYDRDTERIDVSIVDATVAAR